MASIQTIYDRHFVYNACLLASAEGYNCGAFGNACDRSNRGEYKTDFYQSIAQQYDHLVSTLTHEECWRKYVTSPHYNK
jgi:hypothetical protein